MRLPLLAWIGLCCRGLTWVGLVSLSFGQLGLVWLRSPSLAFLSLAWAGLAWAGLGGSSGIVGWSGFRLSWPCPASVAWAGLGWVGLAWLMLGWHGVAWSGRARAWAFELIVAVPPVVKVSAQCADSLLAQLLGGPRPWAHGRAQFRAQMFAHIFFSKHT